MRDAELVEGRDYYAEIDDCCVEGRIFLGEFYGDREHALRFRHGHLSNTQGVAFEEATV